MATLTRNLFANYIGRFWTFALGFVLIPIYIKLMGIESYGLVGFYVTLSSVFGILDLGIGATMSRELARRSVNDDLTGSPRDLVRTLELIYWGIAIIAGAIIIILAPFIANNWLKGQGLTTNAVSQAVQLMGLSLAFQFPMSLYQGGLMGMQKQVLVNIILAILATFRGCGVILVLLLISPTIQAFFVWNAVMSFIGSIVFFMAIWFNLPVSTKRPSFKSHIIKDIWKYAAAISANALIGIILTQLDKVILSKMLSLKMFAYYSIAATVASALWMIILPFSISVFPQLVQIYEKKQLREIRSLFHRSSQSLSLLLLPASALLIFFSKEILIIWINDALIVKNAYLIVSLLVFGTMLNGIASIPANCAPAFGWPLLITYTNLIQAIVIVPLIVGLVYWHQGVGAAIAWIILNSTYILFMVPIFFRRFLREEQRQWYLQDVLAPALSAFAVCIVSFLIAPTMNNKLAILGWIVITGVLALLLTGFVLPHVRKYYLAKIEIRR